MLRCELLPKMNIKTGCYVYLIGSEGTGGYRTYVGWTTNLERRLREHNSGNGARTTRGRQWKLLYAERFGNKRDAMSREWHLKRDRAFRGKLAKAHKMISLQVVIPLA